MASIEKMYARARQRYNDVREILEIETNWMHLHLDLEKKGMLSIPLEWDMVRAYMIQENLLADFYFSAHARIIYLSRRDLVKDQQHIRDQVAVETENESISILRAAKEGDFSSFETVYFDARTWQFLPVPDGDITPGEMANRLPINR